MTHNCESGTLCAAPDLPFDLALLRKGVEWVLEQDELDYESKERTWNQRQWVCGTGMCLAGYIAVELHGAKVRPGFTGTTDEGHVSDVSAALLGIYDCEAERLWHANNTAYDILHHARNIAAHRGEVLGL